MTIEQTVVIPESRRVYFDVPPRIPAGKVRITVQIAEMPQAEPSYKPERKKEADAKRFRESLNRMCLNQTTFTAPAGSPLEPLLGIAEGSSFTVERLLEERRKEADAE
jgi:hypothetical protein